jgi:hypothetical protein
MLHQFTLRVASARVARCIGARHCCAAVRQLRRAMRCGVHRFRVVCGVLRACAARLGEGRACAVGRAAARCARAQKYGGGIGGVLSMAKGTALFDGVAISGTEAYVR